MIDFIFTTENKIMALKKNLLSFFLILFQNCWSHENAPSDEFPHSAFNILLLFMTTGLHYLYL